MDAKELFNQSDITNKSLLDNKTCLDCVYNFRVQCGGRGIRYCQKRQSKRTFNGFLKINNKDLACCDFKLKQLKQKESGV